MLDKKFDNQTEDTFCFDSLPVTTAVCRLGSDRSPDTYIFLDKANEKVNEEIFHRSFSPEKSRTRILKNFHKLKHFWD